MHAPTMSIQDEIRDFRARCQAMREERVSTWGDIVLELPPREVVEAANTQQESFNEREKRARDEQRRVALAAVGRLVRRIGEDPIK